MESATILTPPSTGLSGILLYRQNPELVWAFLSFFLYILPGARFRALSAGVHCTLRVAG